MEIIANAVQTLTVNQNVIFTDTVISGGCSILHREGSGLVTLKGNTNQCRARYKATFGANVALAAGGTVSVPLTLAITLDGEPVQSTEMITTPGAADRYNNVATSIFIDVPRGCCMTIGVKNIGPTETVNVRNANLIVERVA